MSSAKLGHFGWSGFRFDECQRIALLATGTLFARSETSSDRNPSPWLRRAPVPLSVHHLPVPVCHPSDGAAKCHLVVLSIFEQRMKLLQLISDKVTECWGDLLQQ